MANGPKRSRCSNWSHEETMVLAELKKETFNKNEGRLIWEHIAQTMSSRFPDKNRSHDQCRRRWETLTKIYNHIEGYCVVTGTQDHRQLEEDELNSMKLETAYRQDWYNVVKQVCSQRKRKEKDDCSDLILPVKRRNRTDTSKSPSTVLPDQRTNSLSVTPPASVCELVATVDGDHNQPTTATGQISTQPSFEAEKLSLEEEIRRLKRQNDVLTELMQHRQVITQQDQMLKQTYQVLQNSPAEIRTHLKEPMQASILNWQEATMERSSKAAEQDSLGCDLIISRSRSLSPETPSDLHYLGGINHLAGCNDFNSFDCSTYFPTDLSFPTTESWDSPWISTMSNGDGKLGRVDSLIFSQELN